MQMLWRIPWAWSIVSKERRRARAEIWGLPVGLLSPYMFSTNNIYDLAIYLILPDVCFLGINQDKSSAFDPDGVAEPRGKLDKQSPLVWKCARV